MIYLVRIFLLSGGQFHEGIFERLTACCFGGNSKPLFKLKKRIQDKLCAKKFRFCHDRANSNYIIKYNLRTMRIEAQISIGHYSPRKNYYQWGGYSGMDLAVDEQGLWVLFGSTGNSRRLYFSKIDVYKNAVTGTWSLSTGE